MQTMTLSNSWHSLVDWVLPTRCQACEEYLQKESNSCFCRSCWESIGLLDGPCCPRCGIPFISQAALSHSPGHQCGDCRKKPPRFDQAVAAARYEGVMIRAIHLFKYRGKSRLKQVLGSMLLKIVDRLPTSDCLIPVPLHPSRLREREFNQALLLCDYIGEKTHLPVFPEGLQRVRETTPQVGLSIKDRRRNIRQAFVPLDPEKIKGRRVLLVDDVLTTGATVNECARVLKRAGAKRVCVLTVARATVGFI